MRLKDKVAIITGAAIGIGYAAAELFLEEGARVAICDINAEKIAEAAKELSAKGEVRGYACDVSNKEQVDAVVEQIGKDFGRIDILVNNAGIVKDAQFYKMSAEQFDAVINVNLRGNFNMTKAVVPFMMEQKYGKIVHVSSVSGFNGNFGQTNYAASKAAIMGMTRVQGKELGKYGITVNAICPGSIETPMYAAVPPEARAKKLAAIPLRRYGTPREAAKAYLFLASDDSSYMTAQTMVVDGGFN